MNESELWLARLLKLGGLLTGSAFLTIFLPDAAMASTHAALGLGDFPAAPLTAYLTRSLSAMYAFHGVILWTLSTDVRRFRPAIAVAAWGTLGMGVVLTGIDLAAPLPLWWSLTEGPSVVLIGLVLIPLARRVDPG